MISVSRGIMKFFKAVTAIFLCALSASFGQAQEASNQRSQVERALPAELSERQADAIIAEQAEAKELREAERLARLTSRVNFRVLERKEVDLGERRIIMNRVAPPLLAAQPVAEARVEPERPQLSEAEIAEMMRRYEEKEHRTIMLSATVYDRQFTELRWNHEGEQFVAYSSIDFNFMRGVTDFETDGAFYFFFLGIGNEDTETIEERNRLAKEQGWEGYIETHIPQMPAFTLGRAEYAIVADDPNIIKRDEVFDPIDALHAYFEQNERRLRIEYQRTEALNDARKRYQAANPEEPKDTVINFWPVRGSVYQEQPSR